MPKNLSRTANPEAPVYDAAATEELLLGGRLLRRAFTETPYRSVPRDACVAGERAEAAVLIHRGMAYRACNLADGRRAILDLLLPGDIAGLEHIVMRQPQRELVAASPLGYRMLSGGAMRELMTSRAIALRVLAIEAEARARHDRQAAALARLDAQGRICTMLLDIHDRLRRRDLINRPSFNLPLTQEQMADFLGLTTVHVNRTLRHLRESALALVDRQVVILRDLERMREIASGLPPLAEMPEPAPTQSAAWEPAG